MKKNLLPFTIFILLFIQSCSAIVSKEPSTVSVAPLKTNDLFAFENIQRVAFSEQWIVIQTPGKLSAIDLKTHEELWALQPAAPRLDSRFVISDDYLIFALQDEIYMIDKAGKRNPITLSPNRSQLIRLVAVHDSYIYVIRGGEWTLEVYDSISDTMLWERWVGRGQIDIFHSKDKKISYVVTPRNVGAYQSITGDLVWEQSRNISASTFDNATLYILAEDKDGKKLIAIDSNNQNTIWNTQVDLDDIHVYQITVEDNLLTVSTRKGLWAFDKNSGEELWRNFVDDILYTRPIMIDSVIYARGASEVIYAISRVSGDVIGLADLGYEGVPSAYNDITEIDQFQRGIIVNTNRRILFIKFQP